MQYNRNTIIFGNIDVKGLDIEKYLSKEYFETKAVFDTNYNNLRNAINDNNAYYVIVNAYNLNKEEIINIIKDMMDFDPKLCDYEGAKIKLFIITNEKIDGDGILDATNWDCCLLYSVETEKHLIKFGKTLLDYNDEFYENTKEKNNNFGLKKLFDFFAIVVMISFVVLILIFIIKLLA